MFSKMENVKPKQIYLGKCKEEGKQMEGRNFMTVEEVAQELNVSKSYAYKVVRELNAEMRELGYLIVTGRVNTNFFRKKLCYNE